MRAVWALFIFFLALYLVTNGGHTYSNDEESMFFVTAAMARRGEFDTPSERDAPISLSVQGVDGKLYSPYGFLPSVLALPFYHAGSVLASLFPRSYNGYFLRFVILWFLNPLYTALTVILLYQAVRIIGYSERAALFTAFCYGLATMAWAYAKTFFSEPLATLLLLVAFVSLLKYGRTLRMRFAVAAGLAVGFAAATKIVALINLPVLLCYLVWLLYARRRDLTTRSTLFTLIAWGVGAGGVLALVGAFNYVRFGNALTTGYGGGLSFFTLPLWQGLYGLLASPGKSLFLYSPVVLLAIPAFWLMVRQKGAEAFGCLGIIGAHLLTYGVYTEWHGDSAWGPRFMLFVLPFLILPLAALWDWLALPAHARWRPLVAVLFVVSALVQILGVAVNFDIYMNQNVPAALRYYAPQWSPLVGQARVLGETLTDARPIPPMPEGAIARFGWFFDPAQPHPFDVWFLYWMNTGMEFARVAWVILPVLGLCAVGLWWGGRALWRNWRTTAAR